MTPTLQQFIQTVFSLVTHGKWDELQQFFSLIREILAQPRGVITPGTPKDKEP